MSVPYSAEIISGAWSFDRIARELMVRENGQKYWKNSNGTETDFESENPLCRPKEIQKQELWSQPIPAIDECKFLLA
jgi:hypothetical protein